MRHSLRQVGIGVTVFVGGIALLAIVSRTFNDDRRFLRIEEGMSKAEVEAIVGRPHHVKKDGDWYYDLRSFGGPIGVRFSKAERVELVDWSPSYE